MFELRDLNLIAEVEPPMLILLDVTATLKWKKSLVIPAYLALMAAQQDLRKIPRAQLCRWMEAQISYPPPRRAVFGLRLVLWSKQK